ncbi:MAG: VOC family protein [Actinomycetota bacterium]|nr:VOC family protein [Actinomycetota bacterium]
MSDPFTALRAPVIPVDPDPAFAAQLRARVERGLALPKGVTVSDLTLERDLPANAARAAGAGARIRPGDIGYVSLWVPDIERAASFFSAVLGWSYLPAGAAQSRQVAGVQPSHGLHGGHDRSNLFLCFAVDDIDDGVDRVRAAGGTADEPATQPYGRIANCVDDQGSPFALCQPPAGTVAGRPAENGDRQGDLGYVTLQVQDSHRARAFYSSVLGWRFSRGRVADGWGIDGVVPMAGLHGGHERATTIPMYRVDDIGDAVEAIRAAGGSAPEPDRQPYGLSAECLDDQGTRFYVWQPS